MRNYSFVIQIVETAKSPSVPVFTCTFLAQSKQSADDLAHTIFEKWRELIQVVPNLTPYERTEVKEVEDILPA